MSETQVTPEPADQADEIERDEVVFAADEAEGEDDAGEGPGEDAGEDSEDAEGAEDDAEEGEEA